MACSATLSALAATLVLASTAEESRLVIGTEANFPPYVIRDDAGGLSGFDVAVMTEICSRTARVCDWQTAAFDELIPGVASGRFDVALGGIAITAERRRQVDFSIAYTWAADEEWFVGRADAPEPQTARIAAESGTIHEAWLRKEALNVRGYPSGAAAIEAVASGTADLALGPFSGRKDLEPLITRHGFDFLYSVEIPDEGTGIVVCKGNTTLRDAIDQHLAAMMQDGTLDRLDSLWFAP